MKEITLKAKDIKEYVNANFGAMMAANGFDYKKTNNEYFYRNGDYIYRFNMLLTSWGSSYSITVRLGITQTQIEHIYESILGNLTG
jgi:hypothetical protein